MSDSEDYSLGDDNQSDSFSYIDPAMSYDVNNDAADINHFGDDDDNEESFYEDDDEPELVAGWLHDYNKFEIELTKDDPVDTLLKEVFIEEIRYTDNTVMNHTVNGSLH